MFGISMAWFTTTMYHEGLNHESVTVTESPRRVAQSGVHHEEVHPERIPHEGSPCKLTIGGVP